MVGLGRVEIIAVAPMPAMLYVRAQHEGNYYGSYMGRVADVTLNGNGLAQVGLQTGMVASYTFERVRCINCLDVGADLSQLQNSQLSNCVFEHNGMSLGPLSGGLRFSDGASTNRVRDSEIGRNWGWQVIFCDSAASTADGAATPFSDLPASAAGPSQNQILSTMIEDDEGRSHGLIYGRSGQANIIDLCQLSHIRRGQQGQIDMIRLTSEDAPRKGYETASWLIRDTFMHGSGPGYVGLRATGTWDIKASGTRYWAGLETQLVRDKHGAATLAA